MSIVTEIKDSAVKAFAGFKSMAEEAAVLWLQDFAGETYHVVQDQIEHAVEYIETLSQQATAPFAKEEAAIAFVLPKIMAIIDPIFPTGLTGLVAKKAFYGRIENAVRMLIRLSVSYRNALYGTSWLERTHSLVAALGYRLEDRFHLDVNQDGFLGDPALGVKVLSAAPESAPVPADPPPAAPALSVAAPQ